MRLIDADALYENRFKIHYRRTDEIVDVIYAEDVLNAPTYKEGPHGYWRESGGYYQCPFCFNDFVDWSSYCPACGARLER